MSYSVTQDDILSVTADAAVLCVENAMVITDAPVCLRLAEAGGDTLRRALDSRKQFLPVGSAAVLPGKLILPFTHTLITAAPRWENTRGNEILILHRCYHSCFRLAEELGCRTLVMPFLSTFYYGFPQEDAIHIAFVEAGKTPLSVTFVADSPALYTLSQKPYRKPEIASYIGYYRDHAIFELENGRFARVDLRPEITDVTLVPYFEPCFRVGNNPLQEPLPETEIQRLMAVYQESEW